MANDLAILEKPQRSAKIETQFSQLKLKLDFSNADIPRSSPQPQGADFYRDLSDDSNSEQDDYWESHIEETGSVEDARTSSSASTITSSTLDRVSFEPDERNVLVDLQKFEGIVRRAVRQRMKRHAEFATMKHLEEIISEVRDSLAQRLGMVFLDAKPSDPEICYYVLQDSASHDHESLNLLCQLYFARLAAGGIVTSNGHTEANFKVIAKDGSRWEVYAPHSSFLALHERLHKEAHRIQITPPDLPISWGGPLALVEKKEVYLNEVLALPVQVLLDMKEIAAIFRPVEESPIGFDEVYDESLCYRLAEHCCWGERCSCV
jgi:hypothetical protein